MDTSGASYPDRGQPGQRTGGTGQQPRRGNGRGGIPRGMRQIVASLIAMTGDRDLAGQCAQDAFTRALQARGPRRRAGPAPGHGSPRQPATGLSTCCQRPRGCAPRPAADSRPRSCQCHGSPVPGPPDQQHPRPPLAALIREGTALAQATAQIILICNGAPGNYTHAPPNAYRRDSRGHTHEPGSRLGWYRSVSRR